MDNGWRSLICARFISKLKRVSIAFDPDSILSDNELLASIRSKDFSVIYASSALQIRYEYERYWDDFLRGVEKNDLLIVHQKTSDFCIPADIINNANIIKVSLDDIFPNLSSAILHTVSFEQYEDIYETCKDEDIREPLSQEKTCLFLLRTAYDIHCQEIKTNIDFLSLLLRLHYNKILVPHRLAVSFEEYMISKNRLQEWQSIHTFLTDAAYFWNYLQTVWEKTINREVSKDLQLAGPVEINFCNPTISVYLDNIFTEGFLKTVVPKDNSICPESIPKQLFKNSFRQNVDRDVLLEKIQKQEEILLSTIPSDVSTVQEWIRYQQSYSEFEYQCEKLDYHSDLETKANKQFVEWIKKNYDSLNFISSETPIILSKILDYLKTKKNSGTKKIALIVIDGMAYTQWLLVKDSLREGHLSFSDDSCFACIPTLTSVSRQSIFSGTLPRYYYDSINTTAKEEKEWLQSWTGGCNAEYFKTDGINETANELLDKISPMTDCLAIVINAIDELMHSTLLGIKDFYERIQAWGKNQFLLRLLSGLADAGYAIWITADHGNIEAEGVGAVSDGSLSDVKGTRARIYGSTILRDGACSRNQYAESWESDTLPPEYAPMLAKKGYAFSKMGKKVISHGGISIEEVMVPFIKVEKVHDK